MNNTGPIFRALQNGRIIFDIKRLTVEFYWPEFYGDGETIGVRAETLLLIRPPHKFSYWRWLWAIGFKFLGFGFGVCCDHCDNPKRKIR